MGYILMIVSVYVLSDLTRQPLLGGGRKSWYIIYYYLSLERRKGCVDFKYIRQRILCYYPIVKDTIFCFRSIQALSTHLVVEPISYLVKPCIMAYKFDC